MSRTALEPSGRNWRCDICGTLFTSQVSVHGDATCPACGSLIWPLLSADDTNQEACKQLLDVGATIGFDTLGNAWKIELSNESDLRHSLDAINKLERVCELVVSHTEFGDDDLDALKPLRRLEVLCLSNTDITHRAIELIKRFHRLQFLDLSLTSIRSKELIHLNELPRLWGLDLESTHVDRLIPGHFWLEQIELLVLSNTKVGDDSIFALSMSHQLEELWIDNCRLGRRAVKKLHRQLPNCTIHQTAAE